MSDTSRDRILVTITSFLSYATMSAIISPMGIVGGAISRHFEITLTHAAALYSFLTAGILVGSLLSIVVNPLLGSRNAILLSSTALAVALCSLRIVDKVQYLPFGFIIIGACCGILLATAAIVLTAVYQEAHRPSALLATDCCYSFAGFVTVRLAGTLAADLSHWTSVYCVPLVAIVAIICIAIVARYPHEVRAPIEITAVRRKWPPGVYLVSSALFVYLIGFVFIYSWAPVRASQDFNLTSEGSGVNVSRFFLGLIVGQIIMFFLALRVDVKWLVLFVSLCATIATIGLWASGNAAQFAAALFVLGLITGGLLKSLIAYGAQVVEYPTSRLIGFYMFATALGSSLAPALGAYVAAQAGPRAPLIWVTALYCTTFILVGASVITCRPLSRSRATAVESGSLGR